MNLAVRVAVVVVAVLHVVGLLLGEAVIQPLAVRHCLTMVGEG